MKLILLGTGGYYPTKNRHTACLFLPETGIVLDAGSGICRLGRHLRSGHLDVFLTHAHLDHVLGLTYLVNVVPEEVLGRTTVHAAEEKLHAVREHLFDAAIFPLDPPFRFARLDDVPRVPLAEGGVLTHFPLVHPGGSLGFRLDWPGRSLAYVTDTTADPCAAYVEHIRGVDLLVHECYFADNDGGLPSVTGHSWLLPVAEVAARANAGRLVLVHVGPHYPSDSAFDLPAARGIFANVELGTDEMELEF